MKIKPCIPIRGLVRRLVGPLVVLSVGFRQTAVDLSVQDASLSARSFQSFQSRRLSKNVSVRSVIFYFGQAGATYAVYTVLFSTLLIFLNMTI